MSRLDSSFDNQRFMRYAIELGKQNPKAPFGAILVDEVDDEIVAKGVNQASTNPILHGEIAAIDDYSKSGSHAWHRLTLVTTAEPCCMCQAAIIWSGIPHVVYGTSIQTLKRLGWRQFDLSSHDVVDAASFANCSITGGILEPECDRLFLRQN